jgi:hypothetical protein
MHGSSDRSNPRMIEMYTDILALNMKKRYLRPSAVCIVDCVFKWVNGQTPPQMIKRIHHIGPMIDRPHLPEVLRR